MYLRAQSTLGDTGSGQQLSFILVIIYLCLILFKICPKGNQSLGAVCIIFCLFKRAYSYVDFCIYSLIGNYNQSLNDAKAAKRLQPAYIKALVRGTSHWLLHRLHISISTIKTSASFTKQKGGAPVRDFADNQTFFKLC